MKSYIEKILEAAIRAPSGENAQPWKFFVHEESSDWVDVEIVPERDHSPYGWGSRASYVAIGAALENMKIASSSLKKRLSISLFPDSSRPLLVARVNILDDNNATPDPCTQSIDKRATNRKKYFAKTIPEDVLRQITDSVKKEEYANLVFTSKKEDLKKLAEAASANEQLMLSNQVLHQYFFSHVNWTPEEDQKNKVGFFVKTLELPPPAVLGFKLMSAWNRALFMNGMLKMNRLVGKQNATIYQSVPVMGAILTDLESPTEAVKAGMTLERVWLEGTRLGLSMQPLAGLLYIMLSIQAGQASSFSNAEKEAVKDAYKDIEKVFAAEDKTIYFMFRMGYSEPPSAQAIRFPLNEVTA